MLLLGTTDTLFDGEPDEVQATEADVTQILAEAATCISDDVLRTEAICSTFAGLRVLPLGDGATPNARREAVLLRGPAGMLSVAGGKLTTYRRIAHAALESLRAELGLRRLQPRPTPLPGAADLDDAADRLARDHPDLEPRVRIHLAHLYGSLAGDVLAPAADDPDLLRPLHPDGPDVAAQALYARDFAWARRPEDVLRRRTTVALRGLAYDDVRARIEELLSARAGEAPPAASAPSSRAR
jgi:glycerol-3-phosphate dehydrogenase